jgi:hypothetical protein
MVNSAYSSWLEAARESEALRSHGGRSKRGGWGDRLHERWLRGSGLFGVVSDEIERKEGS